MANLQLVGAVGVRVRPDTKNFRRDAKRDILAQLEDLEAEYDVKVSPNIKYDEAKARRAFMDAFDDIAVEQNVKVVPKIEDADFARQLQKLAEQTIPDLTEQRVRLETRDAEQSIGRLLNEIDDLEISLGRLPEQLAIDKDNYSKVFSALRESTNDAQQAIMRYEDELEDLTDTLKDAEKAGAEAAERRAQKVAELSKLTNDLADDEAHLEVLRERWHKASGKAAKAEITRLKTLQQTRISDAKKRIKDIKAEISAMKDRERQLETERNKAEKSIASVTTKIQKQRDIVEDNLETEKDRREGYEKDVVLIEQQVAGERDRLDILKEQLEVERRMQNSRAKTNEELQETLDLIEDQRDVYHRAVGEGLVPTGVESFFDWARRAHKNLTDQQLADIAEVERRREEAHETAMKIAEEEADLRRRLDLDRDIRRQQSLDVFTNLKVAPRAMAKVEAQLDEVTRDRTVFVNVDFSRSRAFASDVLGAVSGFSFARRINKDFKDALRTMDQVAISAANVVSAVALIGGAGAGAAGAMGMLANDIGELLGGLVAAPALMTSFASMIYSTIKGFEQFGAAMDGDAEALATFDKNGRAAARTLGELADQLDEVMKPAFWRGVGSSIADMAEALQGPLVDGLEGASEATGRFFEGWARSLEEFAKSGRMSTAFDDMNEGLNNAARGAKPLLDAINTLGLAGARHLPALGNMAADAAERFASWADAKEQAGELDEMIVTAGKHLRSMGSIVATTTGTISALGDAAERAGYEGLAGVAEGMRDIRDAAKGEFFQGNMARIFSGSMDMISDVTDGFITLGTAVLEQSGVIEGGLQDMGTVARNALEAVADALDNPRLVAGGVEFFNDLAEASERFGPLMDKAANAAGDFAAVAGEVVKGALNIADAFLAVFDDSIAMTSSLQDFIPVITDIIASFVELAHGPMSLAMEALSEITDLFVALPGPVQASIVALGAMIALTSRFGGLRTAIEGVQRAVGNTNLALATRQLTGFGDTMVTTGTRAERATQRINRAFGTLRGGMRSSLGSLVSFLGGPWGLAFAAAAGAVISFGQDAADQRHRIESLRDTLDETGQATARTAEMISSTLNDMQADFTSTDMRALWSDLWGEDGPQSVGESLQRLGMTSGEVADMLINDRASYDELAQAMADLGKGIRPSEEAIQRLSEITGISTDVIRELAPHLGQAGDNMLEVAENTDAARDSFSNLNGVVSPASQSTQELAEAFGVLGDEAASTDDKVRALKDALEILNGGSRSAVEANIDHQKALRDGAKAAAEAATQYGDLSDGLKKVGDGFELDPVTEEAAQLTDALTGIIDPAMEAAVRLKESGASAAETKQPLQEAHAAWMGMAETMGLMPAEAQAVWDQIVGANPDEIVTTLTVDGGDAIAEAESVANTLGIEWSQEKFMAWLEADGTQAKIEGKDAKEIAELFAGEYLAELGVDKSDYDAAMAEAKDLGIEWDAAKFTAWLEADPENAEIAAVDAREAAKRFAEDTYDAKFTADDSTVTSVLDSMSERMSKYKDSGLWKINFFADSSQLDAVYARAEAMSAEITNPDAFKAFITANAEDFIDKGLTIDQMLEAWASLPHEVRVNGATDDAQWKLEEIDGKLQYIEDPKTVTLTADTLSAQEALYFVDSLMYQWDGKTYQADLDGNNQPFIQKKGEAEGVGWIWDGQRFVSTIDGDPLPFSTKQAEASAEGVQFSNFTFTADLAGDTALMQKAKAAADQQGLVWDGSTFTSDLDGNNYPFIQEKGQADGVGRVWDGSRWISTLDADKGPVDDAKWNAEQTGGDWADDTYAGTFDADIGGVRGALDDAILLGWEWAKQRFTAKFDGGVGGTFANGGLIKAIKQAQKFAEGGFTDLESATLSAAVRSPYPENHYAQIAKPVTPFRVWAEPETGGEAYIPLASSKRARSTRIWEETGRRLGVDWQKYADGGVTAGGRRATAVGAGRLGAASGPTINVTNHYPQAEPTSTTINKSLQFAANL